MAVGQTCLLDRRAFQETVELFSGLRLLSRREPEQILELLDDDFEFAGILRYAESVHAHVEIQQLDELPDEEIRRKGGVMSVTRYQGPDMVKYSFPGGIGVIFSAFDIAQDDLINDVDRPPKPYLDHLGVDLRDESSATRKVFDSIPQRAAQVGWRHVHQAAPLYCCYVAVGEKHWIYPPEGSAGGRRPIEFAFGALREYDANMGCDYRPIDPAHPLAGALPIRTTSC